MPHCGHASEVKSQVSRWASSLSSLSSQLHPLDRLGQYKIILLISFLTNRSGKYYSGEKGSSSSISITACIFVVVRKVCCIHYNNNFMSVPLVLLLCLPLNLLDILVEDILVSLS